MALSAIYILDIEGKLLIHRNYRQANVDEIEAFLPTLNKLEDENCITPIINTPQANFTYIKVNDIYLVCSMHKNVNIMLALSLLYTIFNILTSYVKELEEESIQDNFVIIYELLDEIVDYGYPQITNVDTLKEYITQNSHKLEKNVTLPATVTNATSWRQPGIRYRKNEVFVDVVESLNFSANANGNVLQREVIGSVKMKVKLSGMPQLRLGLNDKCLFPVSDEDKYASVYLSDIKFHQCVQLSRFTKDRTISFIPPDGEFELMSYRMDSCVKPLISVNTTVQHYPCSKLIYSLVAVSQFRRSSSAYNVEIRIPVPSDIDSPCLKSNIGRAKYVPENNVLVWFIKTFQGGKEYHLTADMRLPSIPAQEVEKKYPIEVSFVIPYFTISGIQVKYLKIIEKCAYKSLTWVRYITQSGQFQIRLP